MRKWTAEQDQEIIQAADAQPDNLRRAFGELSVEWGGIRSPDAIVVRYYNKLLPKIREAQLPKKRNGKK